MARRLTLAEGGAIGHPEAVSDPQQTDPAHAIALAWQPRATRAALASLFEFDRRMAGVVARAREPMLAQVRLAWWRERLGEDTSLGTPGEPLLTDLAARWESHAAKLTPLIDGWEQLLGEAPLAETALNGFADGRGRAFAAFAELVGAGVHASAALAAGRCWAFADLASRSSDAQERELARSLGRKEPLAPIRSRSLRGIAVLGGLSRVALDRGEPLLEGRGAALTAMRLGLFGG